jgi:hypothetical protein
MYFDQARNYRSPTDAAQRPFAAGTCRDSRISNIHLEIIADDIAARRFFYGPLDDINRPSILRLRRLPLRFRQPNLNPFSDMPNEFDPYREALIIEQSTVWPDDFDDWEASDRARVEAALHADPKNCAELAYIRQHTGFCRKITITEADLERLAAR